MKKIYNRFVPKLTLMVALLLVGNSCTKDYLDRQPNGQLTEEEAFSKYVTVNGMVANLYNRMSTHIQGHYFLKNFMNTSAATDEADANNQLPWPSDLFNTGAWGPANVEGADILNGAGWKGMYEDIRRCTLIIQNVEKYHTPDNDQNAGDLQIRIGETYFLRAYFYHNLIRLYGDVTLLDGVADINGDLNFSRTAFHKVVAQIVADCDAAADRLPVRQIDAELGRAEKGAAYALKARTLLYAARPLWNGGKLQGAADTRKEAGTYNGSVDPQKWRKAAEAAKVVMDLTNANGSKRYELFQLYGPTEYVDQSGNKVSKRLNELFFNISALYTEGIFSHGKTKSQAWQTDNYPPANGGSGRAFPSQEQVDEYEMSNGKAIWETGSGYNEQNPYVNRDPRFYRDVMYHGSTFQNAVINVSASGGANRIGGGNLATKTGYYWRKFYRESYKSGGAGFNFHFMVFRYAEVLLNYAEAQNEYAGPDQSVYDAINQVRARSFMPNLPTGLTKEQMRERVRRERRIELAFENHRFFDARLWMLPDDPLEKAKEAAWRAAGTLDQRAQVWPYPQTQKLVHGMAPTVVGSTTTYRRFFVEERVFETPKHYLFPISADELARASNLNPQNPGW